MAGRLPMGTFARRRERWRATLGGVAVCVAIIAFAGGCHMTGPKAPTGLLGLKWGDDATAGARQLGLTIARWEPWIDPVFETGIDLDHPRAVLGAAGLVRLVRAGGKQLEGIQVIYRTCASDDTRKRQLRDGLRRELHVKSPDVDVPYEIWGDNSLVHFVADPRDDTCTLTVAGPRFGKAFEAALLRGGLGNLGGAIGPR
jgi:hypothetical protein